MDANETVVTKTPKKKSPVFTPAKYGNKKDALIRAIRDYPYSDGEENIYKTLLKEALPGVIIVSWFYENCLEKIEEFMDTDKKSDIKNKILRSMYLQHPARLEEIYNSLPREPLNCKMCGASAIINEDKTVRCGGTEKCLLVKHGHTEVDIDAWDINIGKK